MDLLLGPVVALLQFSVSRGKAAATRISMMALCGAFAAMAATSAIGCVVAALWIFAQPALGPAGAALAAAGALGLLSLVLIAAALIVGRSGRRQARDSRLPIAEAGPLLKDFRGEMLLVALVTGLAAGRAYRNR